MSDWKGFFITFEGIEGSGKTTHANRLWQFLSKQGVSVLLTREPGGTVLGEKLRRILLDPTMQDIDGFTELLLFSAARYEHVRKVILPALEEGKVVICVRYVDSTLAYQGYGRKIPFSFLSSLNTMVVGKVLPEFTVLLDVEPERGIRRSFATTEKEELRFEEEFLHRRELLEDIRKGYLEIARSEPQRFCVVSTTWFSKEEVFEHIKEEVLRRLEGRRMTKR
ncbi:MAG: dTMP kinase [Candidatus Caldatribacteriaceae bacterium]